jgi:hypothetical protein
MMAKIDSVRVTNITVIPNVDWVTGRNADVPKLPLPLIYDVKVTADNNNQPPAGFLGHATDQFVIRGRYLDNGGAFVAGLLRYIAANSDPPSIYLFQ